MNYHKLLWGFIFFFDFRISEFDILPDFIGYIFFYQGLSAMKDTNPFFHKSRGPALLMIFIALFDMFPPLISLSDFYNNPLSIWSLIFGLITQLIHLFIIYNICYGIRLEAKLANLQDLKSSARITWYLYLISNIIIYIHFLFTELTPLLFILVFVVPTISFLMMLSLLKKASDELNQE
ncbi:hypothetical protein [Fusibacter ferrireducens]|uniref:Uncharacterized protein n=1 Tax=Fusibacter ferrireducens TaxID=2785058 RepID=A0ABR9ZQX2_9FIRM|nr:hypothetical protein [Fusibacter ferrireducens]MBF4692553.1 hypothetical protein [Fusibacter ferrireducens]